MGQGYVVSGLANGGNGREIVNLYVCACRGDGFGYGEKEQETDTEKGNNAPKDSQRCPSTNGYSVSLSLRGAG